MHIGPPGFAKQASSTARTRTTHSTSLALAMRDGRTRVALRLDGCNSCTLSDGRQRSSFAFHARNPLLALADLFLEPILMIKSLKN